MSSAPNEQKLSEIWLEDAESDLSTAKSIIQATGIWHSGFFYARLAAEKALKSLCYHLEPDKTSTIAEHKLTQIHSDHIAPELRLEHIRPHMALFDEDHTLCRYIDNATRKAPRDRYSESLAHDACSAAGQIIEAAAKIVRPSEETGEVLYISRSATTSEEFQ